MGRRWNKIVLRGKPAARTHQHQYHIVLKMSRKQKRQDQINIAENHKEGRNIVLNIVIETCVRVPITETTPETLRYHLPSTF